MKYKRYAALLLLATTLAACTRVPSSTEPPPTPTELPAAPPAPTTASATAEPVPTPIPDTALAAEPGGVDVALTLVTIPDQENIARVNDQDISTALYREELERALHSVTAQYAVDWNDPANRSLLPSFQEQVLDQIIDRVLLQQLANQAGISADPEEVETEVAAVQAQIEQDGSFADWASFLAANNLTDELIRSLIADQLLVEALVEQHGGSSLIEQVHASHILIETEETGQEVLDRLDAGEDFGALAAEYSIDPGSKDQGGDLGWFPPGMMVPEFEAAAFGLEAGETSGLVQTDFGYHIIRSIEKGEREMDPALFAQMQQQQFQTWYATQQAQASIERLFSFQE